MINIAKDKLMNGKIKSKTLLYVLISLYLISASAYQRGTGFDALLIRCSFIGLIVCTIYLYPKIKITKMFKWLILFWGIYVTSTLWASNPNDTLSYLNTAIQIIVIAAIIPTIVNNSNDIELLLRILLISFNYAAILILLRADFNFSLGELRLGNEIGLHPNHLGLRMAIGAIISYYFLKTEEKVKYKIIYMISMVLMIVMLFLSGSRKALVLCFAGIMLYEIFQTKGIAIFYKIVLGALIGILIINLLLSNELLYYLIGKRIENVILLYTNNVDTTVSDMSMDEREFYISKAVELFLKNPILGYGGNNFMTYMREIGYRHIAYSHNNFVELLSTLGVVGFGVYYYFWGYTIFNLMLQISKDKKNCDKNIDKVTARKVLILIMLVLLIILDYWNVSYINEINFIIINIASLDVIKSKKEIKENEK